MTDRSYSTSFPFDDPFNIKLGGMMRINDSVVMKRTSSSAGQDEREERLLEGIPPYRVDNLERVGVGDIAGAGTGMRALDTV